MTDFNSFLDNTDEEKKKKATQTPSQQAASDIKKKVDFNSYIDTPKKVAPSIAPKTPTPTPKPAGKTGFDIGGFFNNLGETIKKSLATVIPQLADKKPNLPALSTTNPPNVDISKLNLKPGSAVPELPIDNKPAVPSAQLSDSVTTSKVFMDSQQKTINIIDGVLKKIQNPVDPIVNIALRAIPGVEASLRTYKPGTQPLDIIKGYDNAIKTKLRSINPALETTYDYATFLVPGRFQYFMAKEFEKAPKTLDKIWKEEGKTFTQKLQNTTGEVVLPLGMYVFAPKIMEKIIPPTTLKEIETILGMTYKGNPVLFNLFGNAIGRNALFNGVMRTTGTLELINAAQQIKAGMENGMTKEQVLDRILKSSLSPELLIGGAIFGLTAEAWGIARPTLFGYQKANQAVMTPEQAKAQVEGTDMNGTKAGEVIKNAAIKAEAEGKNIKIEVVAGKEGELQKNIGLEKTQKIADVVGTAVTPGGATMRVTLVDGQTPIQRLTGETPTAKIPKTEVNIESSVVQFVNKSTGEKSFKVIPVGQLEQFKTKIDNSGGQVVIDDQGNTVHLTAKTPIQMEEAGFKNNGVADISKIPAPSINKTVSTEKEITNIQKGDVLINPDGERIVIEKIEKSRNEASVKAPIYTKAIWNNGQDSIELEKLKQFGWKIETKIPVDKKIDIKDVKIGDTVVDFENKKQVVESIGTGDKANVVYFKGGGGSAVENLLSVEAQKQGKNVVIEKPPVEGGVGGLPDNLKSPINPKPVEPATQFFEGAKKGWNLDKGMIVGEPIPYKNKAAITEIENDMGQVLYQATDNKGNPIGTYDDLATAGKAVEYYVDNKLGSVVEGGVSKWKGEYKMTDKIDGGDIIRIASDENGQVGWARYQINKKTGNAYIDEIRSETATGEDMLGQGVGSEIVNSILADKNVKTISGVSTDFGEATGFWKKMGAKVKKNSEGNFDFIINKPAPSVVEGGVKKITKIKQPKLSNKKIFNAIGSKREVIPYRGYAVINKGTMSIATEDFKMIVETKTDLPDGLYKPVGEQIVKMKDLYDTDILNPIVADKSLGNIGAPAFQRIVKTLSNFTSEDDTRPVLQGALFEIVDGKLSYTATDGFRMYHAEEPVNLKDGKYLLPNISELNKISPLFGDGGIEFKENDNTLQLVGNDTIVSLKKVDGDYPPYDKVYPAFSQRYEVSKKSLLDAITELKPFAKLKANMIGFQPRPDLNTLVLKTSFNNEAGEKIEKTKVIDVISKPEISTDAGQTMRGSIIMPVRSDENLIPSNKEGFVLNYEFIEDTLKTQSGENAFISTVAADHPLGTGSAPVHVSDRKEKPIEKIEPVKKKAPEGIASSGAESLGEFETRVPEEEKNTHDLKIFEEVQALIKKYAQTVGEGYTPRGALGVYYSDTKNIRINGMNDLSVASHEITHFLDYAYKISDQLRGVVGYTEDGKPKYDPVTRKFRKEITNLYEKYYPGGKRTHSLKKRTVEGFATLLQKYVEMPKQITAEYPDLVKNFLTPGGEFYHPIMKEIINDLNKFIEEYQALEPLDKIGARVANRALKTDKEFLNLFDKIRTFTEDQIYPIEKLAMKAGVHFTGNDPSLWLRAYSNGGGVYANNILNAKRGYWTLNDKGEFVKKYDFNWKTLMDHLKKEKIDNSFGNYLIARDQHFEWLEYDKLRADYQIEFDAAQDIPKEEWATTIDSTGKTILDKLQEMKKAVQAQSEYLRNNGFTRSEIEEAYNGNKERFIVESKMYDQLVRADLDMLHNPEIGLISNDQYEKLSKKEGYASMKRQMYDDILGNEQDKFVGAKSTKASSLKQRSGGQQQIINPVLNGMVNHIEITKKAMRQAIYNKIGEIAKSAKLPELFQVQKLRAFPDDQGRLIFPQERDPNIIMARIDGKRVPFLVDKSIKKTVDDVLTYQAMNLFENLMVNVSRGFTLGTTGAYAPFALTNVVVDQWSAVQNTRNGYTPLLDISKIIGNALLKKDPEVGQYYQEWQILGGDRMTLFQSQMQTMEDAVKYVTEETNKLEKVKLLLDKGIDVLSIPAKYSETMSRFTEYYKARKAGKNQLVALEEAGRVTAPFHHIGSWKIGDMPSAKYMVRSIPFGNAALQALAQTIRTGQTPEGRKRIMFLIAALIAGYLSSLWAVSQLGSDDQREQYKDLTPTDIATYLHFPAIGGNGLIRIKVSQELSTLGAIMIMVASDNILKTKYNATDYKDALTNWIPRQINIFSPIEMFFSWLPPLIKIPIELLANFKDYPRVKPMENQGMLNKEPGQRFNEATSPLAKAIGQKFNISPIKTDFLIEGFLGRASRLVTGKKGSLDLASGVYRDYFFSMGRRVQDFYDESTAVNQRWNTLKTKYKGKTGLSAEIKSEISSVNKKRLMYGRINDYLGELRKINIKAEPYKATYYRTKIIEGFEQIDKME